jgi:hypothetical protein
MKSSGVKYALLLVISNITSHWFAMEKLALGLNRLIAIILSGLFMHDNCFRMEVNNKSSQQQQTTRPGPVMKIRLSNLT